MTRVHVPDPRPERDALIAATGIEHQLVVVSRNVADFTPLGVEVLDPWEGPRTEPVEIGRPLLEKLRIKFVRMLQPCSRGRSSRPAPDGVAGQK